MRNFQTILLALTSISTVASASAMDQKSNYYQPTAFNAIHQQQEEIVDINQAIEILKETDPEGKDADIQWDIKKYEAQLRSLDEALARELSEKFEKQASISINNADDKSTTIQEESQMVESLSKSINLLKGLDPQGIDQGIQWDIKKYEAQLNNLLNPLSPTTGNDEALARQLSEGVEIKSPLVQVGPQIVPSTHETITDIIQQQNRDFEESERQDRAKAKREELVSQKTQIEEELKNLGAEYESAEKIFNQENNVLLAQIASHKRRIEVAKAHGPVDSRLETKLSELEATLAPKMAVFLESQGLLFSTLLELNEKKEGIELELKKLQS